MDKLNHEHSVKLTNNCGEDFLPKDQVIKFKVANGSLEVSVPSVDNSDDSFSYKEEIDIVKSTDRSRVRGCSLKSLSTAIACAVFDHLNIPNGLEVRTVLACLIFLRLTLK